LDNKSQHFDLYPMLAEMMALVALCVDATRGGALISELSKDWNSIGVESPL